jgi:hypothetical protein
MGDLHANIALFIASYRAAAGDPSAMQAAVRCAFPGSSPADFAVGLVEANRATRGAPSLTQERPHA